MVATGKGLCKRKPPCLIIIPRDGPWPSPLGSYGWNEVSSERSEEKRNLRSLASKQGISIFRSSWHFHFSFLEKMNSIFGNRKNCIVKVIYNFAGSEIEKTPYSLYFADWSWKFFIKRFWYTCQVSVFRWAL